MGNEQTRHYFAPVAEFGDELRDCLLLAPVGSSSDLGFTLHFVDGRTDQFAELAAVFTRELVQEADMLLGVILRLKVTSAVFPKSIIFRQVPKVKRFEVVWSVIGRGKLTLFEKCLRQVYRERESLTVQHTDSNPISTRLVESPELNQVVQLVTYRGASLRSFNPYMEEALKWLRLRHAYIRSVLNLGISAQEDGNYVSWIQLEYFPHTLAEEVARRKASSEPFTEAELLHLFHQLVNGLRFTYEHARIIYPRITPATILIAPNGAYKLDFGVPWVDHIDFESRTYPEATGLGETLLSAALLKPFTAEADLSTLPYSNQLKNLLSSLLDSSVSGHLDRIERDITGMTFLKQLEPFEVKTINCLIPTLADLRRGLGYFSFPPLKDPAVHFSPLQLGVLGYYVGERNWLQLPHGRGILISHSGKSIYEGEFVSGVKYGKGMWFDEKECVYLGDIDEIGVCYESSTFRGPRIYTWGFTTKGIEEVYCLIKTRNTFYEGTLVKGKKTGWGYFKTQDWTYEGEWNEDSRNGKGKCTFKDGRVFNGLFRHNEMVKGEMQHPNGDRYSGSFQEDLYEGWGRMTHAGHWEYQGEWKGGLRHGTGTCTFPSGDVYEGTWVEDALVGLGVVIHADGVKEEVDFSNYEY